LARRATLEDNSSDSETSWIDDLYTPKGRGAAFGVSGESGDVTHSTANVRVGSNQEELALWFNASLGLAMFFGRFAYVIPVLALGGSFAAKKKALPSAGTFPTHGPLFVGLLLGVILILYLLQYFPALSLGPVVEHFLLQAGKVF
jgi:hypothetical protein